METQVYDCLKYDIPLIYSGVHIIWYLCISECFFVSLFTILLHIEPYMHVKKSKISQI